MKKKDIINRVNRLNFNREDYWLVSGAVMVLHGFREETNDIDMGCTPRLADMLEKEYPVEFSQDEKRCFRIAEDIEVFEDWLEGTVEYLEDIPVISIDGLLTMKRKLGRAKDLKDIELIEKRLDR